MKAEEEQQVGKVISCRWQPRHEAHFESARPRRPGAQRKQFPLAKKATLEREERQEASLQTNGLPSPPAPMYPGQKAAISGAWFGWGVLLGSVESRAERSPFQASTCTII